MSTRLPSGGRLVDRSAPLKFTFNGRKLKGLKGDTLASALLANNQLLVGRSFKYHRPRGIVACGPEEPNALLTVGDGDLAVPNQRATMVDLVDGLAARSQNHWPSLEHDLGAAADAASKLLPAGFYYKTFIKPRPAWKHLFEPAIRRAAGLGKAPMARDPETYEHFYIHADVLVVGGGVAGLAAASVAAEAGMRVVVLEQSNWWGGRALADEDSVEDVAPADWVEREVGVLSSFDNVRLLPGTAGIGVYDHGYAVACQRRPAGVRPCQRLWRIRARKTSLASGALERPLCFEGNDTPGVFLASAARDYLRGYGVSPGDRVVVLTNNDDGYRTASAVVEAGLSVPAVLDVRPTADGPQCRRVRDAGIRVEFGKGIASAKGGPRVSRIAVCSFAGEGTVLEELACEAVAMSGGWSPTVHLWSHSGGKLRWDERQAMYRPMLDRPPINSDGKPSVHAAGAANGECSIDRVLQDARAAAGEALADLGSKAKRRIKRCSGPDAACDVQPAWLVPQGMRRRGRNRAWVDFQNDVKVSDIRLAAQEGYRSVEHLKRYTTLGMATDQGKLSNINGLGVLAGHLGVSMGEVGTTTFRPPYVPVTLGAIAGEARGPLFMPTRKTPMDGWHEQHGAYWEPVGSWRRPYCYLRSGEEIADAVNRETLRVRTSVGILDASTLGKIVVQGPDSGRLLDMVYTNRISALGAGRCRYGLMCNENGFLMDDGVVARIDEQTFLCHTTTGGAGLVHAWLEEWLQGEWWDWKVHVADLTEQFSQIGIAGPDARRVLEKLLGGGVGADELPFMAWKQAEWRGLEIRLFRISFSGEISFEIAVPSSHGQELWDELMGCGEEFGIEPYGTEALHVLRAEKGFIMIGEETDGTVTPQDLGLHWAIAKGKADYMGKRAQERPHLSSASRWRFVGLERMEGDTPLPSGSHAVSAERSEHGHPRAIGRVTSSYYSPNLKRPIALGLVERGPERMGEVLEFLVEGGTAKARIVAPVFFDPEGLRLNA